MTEIHKFPIGKKGVACVICNGCPENRIDAARAEQFLKENGWAITENWREADIILFNGCAGIQANANSSLGLIREIQKEKKVNQVLVVWGCLPKIYPEATHKFSDVIIGESESPNTEQIIGAEKIEKTIANYIVPIFSGKEKNKNLPAQYRGSIRNRFSKPVFLHWVNSISSKVNLLDYNHSVYFIKISTGCLGSCSYCGIRKARGRVKSKPLEEIVNEFQTGLQKGFKHFSLLGTDLSVYGSDLGYNLVNLLEKLVNLKGNFRINLRNVNPLHLLDMLDSFSSVLKSGKIRYIETAAESGSNRILDLMNRGYTIEEYKTIISTLRKASPKILIRTQLMAGFPTETEQEFMETMNLIDEVMFDFIEVYEYYDVLGTAAAKIEPKVTDQVKNSRNSQLYKKAMLDRSMRKIKQLILQT